MHCSVAQFDKFRLARTNLNQFGPIETSYLDPFGPIQIHLELFGPIWTHLDPFGPTGPIKITLGNAVGDTFGSVLEKQF